MMFIHVSSKKQTQNTVSSSGPHHDILSDIYSYILSGILSDILSGILAGNLSDILAGILCDTLRSQLRSRRAR